MSQRPNQKRPSQYALELKRSYTDHKLLQKDPFILDNDFYHSRHIRTTPFQAKFKQDTQTQPKYKQSSLDSYPTQTSEEQTLQGSEGIDKFQEKMIEAMNADLRESIHAKQRTNYGNRYEQQEDTDCIWISQPKWIPQQIQREYNLRQQELKAGEKVNFFQGFLSQLGFMYYAVERKVYFYDVQTMNQNSTCSQIIQTQAKFIDVFYGVQVLEIGPPYLSHTRKVLVFFHFQEAELYHFSISKDHAKNERTIQIKYLNISYTLQQTRPNKLVLGANGKLYYVDQKGAPRFIETDHSFINKTISNISQTSKRMTKNVKDFLQNATKNIAKNVINFSKVVYNFSRSLFSKRSLTTDIVSDPNRNLIITYYCEQLAKMQLRQQLNVYSSKEQILLYALNEEDFLDKYSKNDFVIKIKVIEGKVNNDYNLVLLLYSGKRVFLDITEEYLKKSIIYQPSHTNQNKYYGDPSQNILSIESSVIEERFYLTLLYSDSLFRCNFVKQVSGRNDNKYQSVSRLILQVHGGPRQNQYYMFTRQLQELGPIKKTLLQSQNQQPHPKHMSFEVQAVFYRPQEIVHTSDKMAQRIMILRPVDVLFTLLSELSNIFQVMKGIKICLNYKSSKEIVGYCCQILLDQEGAYYISRQLGSSVKEKLTIRTQNLVGKRDQNIQEVLFNDLSKQLKNRVEELIIDLIKSQPLNKQNHFLIGVISYVAKLLRPIWYTSINSLKSETCKYCLSFLQAIEQLISKFKKRLRLSNQGLVGASLNWLKKLWELIFLIKTIPTLPQRPLFEVICLCPSQLHQYIFNYLIKYCQPRMLQDLRRSVPIYIDNLFAKYFKFWLSLQGLTTREEKINLCKEHSDLPEYLIEHISKIKGLEDIRLFFQGRKTSTQGIQKYLRQVDSYKNIIHCLKQASDTLIAKEILLEKAKEKLQQEAKHDENLIQEGLAEIAQIHSLIHLQKLLKQYYMQNKQQGLSWKGILSKVVHLQSSPQLSVQQEINVIFQTELFDLDTLSSLIEATKDPLLDLAFANYYLPDQVINKLNDLIIKSQTKVSNIRQLPSIYMYQIEYLLMKAKIGLSRQVLIRIYIQRMSQLQGVVQIMQAKNGVLEQQMYFPLSWLANISAGTQNIWKWAKKTLCQLDKSSSFYKYLCACTTYFAKDYFPQKKKEFSEYIDKMQNNEDLFKQMKALLSEENS